MQDLLKLFTDAYTIMGWPLYGLTGLIFSPVIFSAYLLYREYQQNKRERRLVQWHAALKAATDAYWAHQTLA